MRSSLAAGLCFALLSLPGLARADWPTSPFVNLPICTVANNQSIPVAIPDMAGGVIVVWQDLRNGADFNIYAQRILADGTAASGWPAGGVSVCAAAGAQVNPRAVSDGAGGALIAWQDNRAGTASDVYAEHLLSSGSLDPVWPAGGSPICTAAGLQSGIGIVTDGAHGAVIGWRDTRNDTDYYAARVLANGVLDPAWQANGSPICVFAGAQLNAAFLSDGSGGLFATWQDTRGGATADIYAQHLLVNGAIAPGWPVNGTAVCTATGVQEFPAITGDGAGGIFVGWEDLRGGATSDVYVNHIQSNGTPDATWPTDGRAVCTATGNQTRPRVLGDGSGGVLAAWIDARLGSNPQLYAQHVLSTGSLDPALPAGDVALCLAFGSHSNLVLMPDGTGGALVAWDDGRSGLHIYAHHLLHSGLVDSSWPADGRAVSNAAGSQSAGGAGIPDGSGGLILAWTDTRSQATTGSDIYGQRVQANSQLGGTVVGVSSVSRPGFVLRTPTPTPSRRSGLRINFTLPDEGAVFITLLDVGGRALRSWDLGILGAGAHEFPLGSLESLPAGVYLVRMSFHDQTLAVRAPILE